MEKAFKESLWKQFGASIDMLENAIKLCPVDFWDTGAKFWYNVYHCLFFLDYYLETDPVHFTPPPPFTLSEFDPSGAMPEMVYSKDQLLSYLQMNRKKCHDRIAGLTTEKANGRWMNTYINYSFFELLLYNMRHVQHHAAQLNLLLRQGVNNAPRWVPHTKAPL